MEDHQNLPAFLSGISDNDSNSGALMDDFLYRIIEQGSARKDIPDLFRNESDLYEVVGLRLKQLMRGIHESFVQSDVSIKNSEIIHHRNVMMSNEIEIAAICYMMYLCSKRKLSGLEP